MKTKAKPALDFFTLSYIECALWSSSAELGICAECECDRVQVNPETERCAECGEPVRGTDRSFSDLGFDLEDIAPEALDTIVRDCAAFREACADYVTPDSRIGRGDCTELAGHDFWLTRNRHGAGFWDGDWIEPEAELLTQASHAFGEIDLYLGDDGKIYI